MLAYWPIISLIIAVLIVGGLLIMGSLKNDENEQKKNNAIYNIVDIDTGAGIPYLKDEAIVLGKRFVERYSRPVQRGSISIVEVLGPTCILDLRVGLNMRAEGVISADLGRGVFVGDKLQVSYIIQQPSGAPMILRIK